MGKTLRAAGDYGLFEGSAEDRVVFGAYRRDSTWAPALVSLLGELLGAGGTLIDVGANIGLVSIPVLERAPAARALAFEPAADNHAYLCSNVAAHGLGDRLQSFRLALHDEAGCLPLRRSLDNSGDHRLDPAAPDSDSEPVRTERLDVLLAGARLQDPVVMKVDTQGAELRVLRGAGRLLSRVDTLVVEYWPAGLRRMGDGTRALRQIIAGAFEHGTVLEAGVYRIEELRPTSTARVFERLAWIADDGSDEGFFDLLFTRRPSLCS